MPDSTNSTTAHTPAPWVYAPDYDENDGDIIIANDYSRPVAICFKSDLQDEEQYPRAEVAANANLIAAAPKLLEALTDVAEWWAEEVAKDKAGKPSLFTVPMYGAPACMFTVNQVLTELKEGQK